MLVKSEVLELARLMERGEGFAVLDRRGDVVGHRIKDGSREWEIIIEVLRVAAATLPSAA